MDKENRLIEKYKKETRKAWGLWNILRNALLVVVAIMAIIFFLSKCGNP